MGIEIERRFLVFAPPGLAGMSGDEIVQGYLTRGEDAAVRVRLVNGTRAFLTVKGPKSGGIGMEYEYEIPSADAAGLLPLCGDRVLTKTRYGLPGPDGARWELDMFTGRHDGLIIAEIELPDINAPFADPDWLGPEITADARFGNAGLAVSTGADVRGRVDEYRVNRDAAPTAS